MKRSSGKRTIKCPHPNCGHEWTPRKEKPKKCPQCANPLWQSPKPKRKTRTALSAIAAEVPQEIVTNTPEVQSDASGAGGSLESTPFNQDEPIPPGKIMTDKEFERIIFSPPHDPIQQAKAKAEELLRRLNAPSD